MRSMSCSDLSLKHQLPHSNLFLLSNDVEIKTKNQGQCLSLNLIQSSVMYNLGVLIWYICAPPNVSKAPRPESTIDLTKLLNSDALYILKQATCSSHCIQNISLHTHTHTLTGSPFHHLKSNSPSRTSWPTLPWRVSCEGPEVSPADDRTSFWSSSWKL